MPTSTYYLTPTSVFTPPHAKGFIKYRVKTFGPLIDTAVLDAEIAAFFDSLSVDGEPFPHLISTELATVTQGGMLYHSVLLTYMLVAS